MCTTCYDKHEYNIVSARVIHPYGETWEWQIMKCPNCSSSDIDIRYEGNKTIHMCAICKWFKLDWRYSHSE